MEFTITQNGALYALQHRGSEQFYTAPRKRAIADKRTTPGHAGAETSRAHKFKTEELWFISSGT
jgi:hypothetical protein